jgi:hypothetical protein
MATDNEGNLKPLMLSELIIAAQKAIDIHGDMIVWVETMVAGYEYNEEHSLPVSDIPEVDNRNLAKQNGYWQDNEYIKSFIIQGV